MKSHTIPVYNVVLETVYNCTFHGVDFCIYSLKAKYFDHAVQLQTGTAWGTQNYTRSEPLEIVHGLHMKGNDNTYNSVYMVRIIYFSWLVYFSSVSLIF